MSAAAEIAEVAADGVADTMHVVGEEALALEEATRGLEAVNLAYFGLGLAAGAATGAFIAYKIAYRKAEEKYNEIAAEEIAEMREHFRQKEVAIVGEQEKGSLEKLVKDKGYTPSEESTRPPLAVAPPAAVVEAAEVETDEVEEPPSSEEDGAPQDQNVFRDVAVPEEPEEWDWHKERARRSPLRPYVIHRDEREEKDAYDHVTYTYYEQDDVVCDERDDILDEADRERLFGEENLNKFGHGSGDATVVYVRNDKEEMDIEIVQSPNSYAMEVHGLEPEIKHSDRRRGGRTQFDDD